MPAAPREIGDLLTDWQTGDKEALRLLFPLIYVDLRRLAHHHLHEESGSHPADDRGGACGLPVPGEA